MSITTAAAGRSCACKQGSDQARTCLCEPRPETKNAAEAAFHRKQENHSAYGSIMPRMVKYKIAAMKPDAGTVTSQAATIFISAERLTSSLR